MVYNSLVYLWIIIKNTCCSAGWIFFHLHSLFHLAENTTRSDTTVKQQLIASSVSTPTTKLVQTQGQSVSHYHLVSYYSSYLGSLSLLFTHWFINLFQPTATLVKGNGSLLIINLFIPDLVANNGCLGCGLAVWRSEQILGMRSWSGIQRIAKSMILQDRNS